MHTTKVKLKDGTNIEGHVWSVRPAEGWFTIISHDTDQDHTIRMEDCESVVTLGERISKNKIGDQDMLAVWAERAEQERR